MRNLTTTEMQMLEGGMSNAMLCGIAVGLGCVAWPAAPLIMANAVVLCGLAIAAST